MNVKPAAKSRRFPYFVGVPLMVLVLTAGCMQAPPDPSQWDGFRAALNRANRDLRRWDARVAGEVERLVSDAEAVTARERTVAWWRRDPGRAPAAWNRALVTAQRSLTAVRAERAAQTARLALLLDRAEVRIAGAEARVGRAGVNGRHAGETATARYHATAARKLAESGELGAALEHAEEAMALSAGLDHSWSRAIERFSDPILLELWRGQVADTIGESRRSHGAAIIIDKFRRRLHLYENGRERAVFAAELGGNGLERKLHSGDRATPEGRYRVTVKKSGGATKYYLALLIDYPNPADLSRYRAAEAAGKVPRGTGAGGLIEIHGHGGTGRDWTDGCVALTNEDMDLLFDRVRVGTPVTIVGAL